MKCEICHQREAETALVRMKDGVEDELYVCQPCAAAERRSRQQKSQRTRKANGLPPGVTITAVGSGDAPPFIGAILNAVSDIVNDLHEGSAKPEKKARALQDVPLEEVPVPFAIRGRLHLEGLHLIGELEAAVRAAHALELELVGLDVDGVKSVGHAFVLRHENASERARSFADELQAQERNARVRLFEELPRVLGDSLCRALAILKNCRLLSPGELFDLLSPLRLAAIEKMLDGIGLAEIDRLLADLDLSGSEDKLEQEERDRVDAERADQMNRRFEEVVLNERAEEKFL